MANPYAPAAVLAAAAVFAGAAVSVHLHYVKVDAPEPAPRVTHQPTAPPPPVWETSGTSQSEMSQEELDELRRAIKERKQARAALRRDPTRRLSHESEGEIVCATQEWACELVRAAADQLPYPWRALGWDVHVEPEQEWLAGLARPSDRTIRIYPRHRWDVAFTRYIFAHEVGHVVDYAYSSPERKSRYRYARGLAAEVPDRVDPPHDFDSRSEDFAEVFAWWQTRYQFRSTVAAVPRDVEAYVWYFYPDRTSGAEG